MDLNILNGYEHQSSEQPETGNWLVLKDSIVLRFFTSNTSNTSKIFSMKLRVFTWQGLLVACPLLCVLELRAVDSPYIFLNKYFL